MTLDERRLWQTESGDTYSAETSEDVLRIMVSEYGYSSDEVADEDPEEIDQCETHTVRFGDGCGSRDYPAWVDHEDTAEVFWDRNYYNGRPYFVATVSAEARLWAKHETGMVSTENW